MKIKELNIAVMPQKLSVTWRLADGVPNEYDLFLIKRGAVLDRIKGSDGTAKGIFSASVEPMQEYHLLLTVKSGGTLSTARAAFFIGTEKALVQRIRY